MFIPQLTEYDENSGVQINFFSQIEINAWVCSCFIPRVSNINTKKVFSAQNCINKTAAS